MRIYICALEGQRSVAIVLEPLFVEICCERCNTLVCSCGDQMIDQSRHNLSSYPEEDQILEQERNEGVVYTSSKSMGEQQKTRSS